MWILAHCQKCIGFVIINTQNNVFLCTKNNVDHLTINSGKFSVYDSLMDDDCYCLNVY